MHKLAIAAALAAALTPTLAHAEAGDWVVRVRAAHVSPDEDSKVSLGGQLEVDSNTIPELDISYYFTRNLAAELILATGTRHDVDWNTPGPGKADLGSVNLLPPTLTLQWHFRPDQTIDPYVGAGINYTRFMDNSLKFAGAVPIRVDRNSWGPALQAGVDINLKDGWLINADVKKVWIDSDVKANLGAGYVKIDSLDIDPWIIGLGVGKKF